MNEPKYYALCKANTMANGTGGYLYHAFDHDARETCCKALCGTKPGKCGYWSSYFGTQVTCPKCVAKFSKLEGKLCTQ